MSDTSVAKRYAVALFQIAKEQNLLDSTEEELRAIKEVFSNNNEFQSFLQHPKVSVEEKKRVIGEAFASLSTQVKNTLLLMTDRHRTDVISQMAIDFIELANEERSVAEAHVYSVRLLNDSERKAVSSAFAARVGKRTLRIENIVDRSVLGGIKLRIGNRIYDGSVSGKLERLEKELLG
ncbi:F0F1 ATP synthase subunit delta [Peribacillus cavernae]|uniref:ATP synthase subunit delta n=1 Tax=Peribacillus cavernae TaxID=1674310 RepID=A0A433HT55_9BACI|nr:F0F1 ATP synthase subunit delta [Peribacillus cavernae]MDQ0218507.1 F-type H+-transporting ATPase subunit delta [Peribacillus cavernae]RUQ31500.1 F0F1 ATP synthase subunit delta [Peribacillus cavernae]